jgi:type IV pilus assembly protein PilC
MNADDLITLNEEIAGMAKAGLPLDQGLAILAREMGRGRLQRATAQIAEDLRRGQTLPEALKHQGNRIPSFYSGLVQAGIRSGRFDEILASLTLYARSLADLRATLFGALFYPGVVLLIATVIFSGMAFFVLPQFGDIFSGMGMRLPALTTATIWIVGHAELLFLPVVVIGGGLMTYWLTSRFSERGRLVWARFIYTIPAVGTLLRSTRLASFSELLAILIDQSIPLPEAFAMAGEASSDPVMSAASRQVVEDLNQGVPLSTTLRNRHLVPELIAWMTAFGEQRGQLGKALHQVAELYRRQVEMRAAFLRYVLPPFMIIITAGVLVTLFVLTLILPMYKLLEGLMR